MSERAGDGSDNEGRNRIRIDNDHMIETGKILPSIPSTTFPIHSQK